MSKKNHIALASDHAYAGYMETCMLSVLMNNPEDEIVFDILDVGLDDNDKRNIAENINSYGGELVFHDLRNIAQLLGGDVPEFLNSLGLYGRLFLPQLLPNEEKVLYLDCDTLVVGSLNELWNMNITDYYLAGVKDTVSFMHREKLGFGQDETYINSGVLLINLEKWRKDHICEKIIDYVKKNKESVSLPDQDGINVVCKGKICILEANYNVMSPQFLMPYKNIVGYFRVSDYYSSRMIKEARNNPVIIHFTGYPDRRPWEKGCMHPKKALYMEYASKSRIGVKLLDKDIPKSRKKNLIKFKFLPYGVYKILRSIKK